MSSLKEKTISSLIWKFLERGGSAAISLVVSIVMARLLTPEDYGVLAIIVVFVNISITVSQAGLSTAIIQSPHINDEDLSTVFWMCLIAAAVLYIVLFICAPFIAYFYSAESVTGPLRVLSLVLIINAFSGVQIAVITRNLQLKKTFIATLLSIVISGFIGIVSALIGVGIWALVIQQVLYQIVTVIVLFAQVTWRPKLCFNSKRAVELFSFSWKLLASGLLNTVYQSLSSLIIGKQFSKNELGFVSQGEKYPAALGTTLDGSIQPVVLSTASRLQGDSDSVKGFMRRALMTSTFIIIPVMAAFALMADSIINLLLGEKWLPAVPFLQMYCFVYALYPIQTSNLQVINAMGRSDVFLKLEIIKKILGVAALCIAAFIIQDVYAIVASFMIMGIVSMFINAYPNKRLLKYGLIDQLRDILPSIFLTAASIAMAALWHLLDLMPIISIVLQCITIITVYLVLAKLFKVEEFEYLLSTFKEIVGKAEQNRAN